MSLVGYWAVSFSGNRRVIFRFNGSDVELADYLDITEQETNMAMHNPPHPGEALREDVLPAIRMSVAGLARHIGYSRGQLSSVINGRASISATLAHQIELAGLGSARQYLAEQAAYDLWQARHRGHPPIKRLHPA